MECPSQVSWLIIRNSYIYNTTLWDFFPRICKNEIYVARCMLHAGYSILYSLVFFDNVIAIMKKIYTEIPKQRYSIVNVDIIQMFIKTFPGIDIVWRSVN